MALGEDFGALENDNGENHFFVKAIHGSFAFTNIVRPTNLGSTNDVALPSSMARATLTNSARAETTTRNPGEMSGCIPYRGEVG